VRRVVSGSSWGLLSAVLQFWYTYGQRLVGPINLKKQRSIRISTYSSSLQGFSESNTIFGRYYTSSIEKSSSLLSAYLYKTLFYRSLSDARFITCIGACEQKVLDWSPYFVIIAFTAFTGFIRSRGECSAKHSTSIAAENHSFKAWCILKPCKPPSTSVSSHPWL